ncbi:MAG: CBS domain-containing protein [Thaumarchaeota archaeon]|nr:CBS domain-containing protein [Nitrososphaerota archaeon]
MEGGTAVLVAGTLLDTPRRDVLPIVKSAKDKNTIGYLSRQPNTCLAFSGYSLIAKLLETDPKDHYKFLFQPCESASMVVHPISEGRANLSGLLDSFAKSRFGWAMVGRGSVDARAVVTLADLMPLYGSGILLSDLAVEEVATRKIFSLPRNTKLKEALHEMMRRRVRRVFLTGEESFVSGREILEYIFSPQWLSEVRESPKMMLEAKLEDVEQVKPVRVDGKATIKETSKLFMPENGSWRASCDAGIVTSWDLVVKPWKTGRLAIGEKAHEGSVRGEQRR